MTVITMTCVTHPAHALVIGPGSSDATVSFVKAKSQIIASVPGFLFHAYVS